MFFNENEISICGLYFIVSLLPFSVFAQEKSNLKYELSIATDNDWFVEWHDMDRYYTYGLGVNFKFKPNPYLELQKKTPKATKKFFEVGIRMEAYTPSNKEVLEEDIKLNRPFFDRPYAQVFCILQWVQLMRSNALLSKGSCFLE